METDKQSTSKETPAVEPVTPEPTPVDNCCERTRSGRR